MKDVYFYITGKNLPIYAIPTRSMNIRLQAFCQTERDYKLGKQRMPAEKYRLISEEEGVKADKS